MHKQRKPGSYIQIQLTLLITLPVLQLVNSWSSLFFCGTETLRALLLLTSSNIVVAVESRKDSRACLTRRLWAKSERSVDSWWAAADRTEYSVAVSKSAFLRMFTTVSSIFRRLLVGMISCSILVSLAKRELCLTSTNTRATHNRLFLKNITIYRGI